MRRAKATVAIFRPRRCASRTVHVLSHVEHPRFVATVAPWHNARPGLTSPAFVMPPDTSRSPDRLREAVGPTQGPTLFEDRKGEPLSPSVRDKWANATTAPTPGIVIERRQTGSPRGSRRTCFSRAARSNRKDDKARNIGSVAVSSMRVPSANPRMRASTPPREIAPTLSPKFRGEPLGDISRAIVFRRSVPIGIASRAPSTWRVSTSTASRLWQTSMQPLRHRPGLQANRCDTTVQPARPTGQYLRFARRLPLADRADCDLRERYIHSNKQFHPVLLSCGLYTGMAAARRRSDKR